MDIQNISDNDAKALMRVKQLLMVTVKNVKFSLGEAKIADEAIRWFDGFIEACGNIQKMEAEAKKKQVNTPAKTEGLGSLKIKDMNPGTYIPKSKSKAKSKPKAKGRK